MQATQEAHFREKRFADTFQGLNFGILEIKEEPSSSAAAVAAAAAPATAPIVSAAALQRGAEAGVAGSAVAASAESTGTVDRRPERTLEMTIRDKDGVVVITKAIKLRRRGERLQARSDGSDEKKGTDEASATGAGTGAGATVCEPWWGPVPPWRHLLTRLFMATGTHSDPTSY